MIEIRPEDGKYAFYQDDERIMRWNAAALLEYRLPCGEPNAFFLDFLQRELHLSKSELAEFIEQFKALKLK